jgi:uncharacterized protein (TIRG00374 family)
MDGQTLRGIFVDVRRNPGGLPRRGAAIYGSRQRAGQAPCTTRSAVNLTLLPSWRTTVSAWVFGLLLLGGVIVAVLNIGEIEELARVIGRLQPEWLIAAAALQALTYVCAAWVWWLALAHEHHPLRMGTLVPAALAMLFVNQAFPTAGVSGGMVVVRALRRRRVPPNVAVGALLVGLITSYAAYMIAVVISLFILRAADVANAAVFTVSALFALTAIAVPMAVLWYRQSLGPRLAGRIQRAPVIGKFLKAVATAPSGMLRDPKLLSRAAAVQFAQILLDAATLQVMLVAVGITIPPAAAFASFAIALAVAWAVPVPLGLGTFEGSLVSVLHLFGVPVEPGLAATLLLRGFTLWLPMLPGLWCARGELRMRRPVETPAASGAAG